VTADNSTLADANVLEVFHGCEAVSRRLTISGLISVVTTAS
jgi:hypothetical protein